MLNGYPPEYATMSKESMNKALEKMVIIRFMQPDDVQIFMKNVSAGELNFNTEEITDRFVRGDSSNIPMLAHRSLGVKVIGDIDIWQNEWADETYQYFAVEKMRFAKVRDENGKLVADKTRIIYNSHITIENIPLKAYEYIVNGKSAIDWVMERYAVTIDKASQIKNDPNDWSREHEQPRYILDLLLSVIILSFKTVNTVDALPKLKI